MSATFLMTTIAYSQFTGKKTNWVFLVLSSRHVLIFILTFSRRLNDKRACIAGRFLIGEKWSVGSRSSRSKKDALSNGHDVGSEEFLRYKRVGPSRTSVTVKPTHIEAVCSGGGGGEFAL